MFSFFLFAFSLSFHLISESQICQDRRKSHYLCFHNLSFSCCCNQCPLAYSVLSQVVHVFILHISFIWFFLQETHLEIMPDFVRNELVYHSKFVSKSRGVAIIINKWIPFSPSQTLVDSGGRYVFGSGLLYGLNLIMVTILLMGGDFNCSLNPSLDRSYTKPAQPSKTAITLQSLLTTCSQVDVWRFLYPTARQY